MKLLSETAAAIAVGIILQNRPHADPATYIGTGKVRELKGFVAEKKVDILIFDDELSPTQLRNIENVVKIKVLDRSGLILDIFATRAQTAAAITQVEDRKSTRLNSSHVAISYAVFCLKKKND